MQKNGGKHMQTNIELKTFLILKGDIRGLKCLVNFDKLMLRILVDKSCAKYKIDLKILM